MAGYVYSTAVAAVMSIGLRCDSSLYAPPASRSQLGTNTLQLGLPREPRSDLSARIPEARWHEGDDEVACEQRVFSRCNLVHAHASYRTTGADTLHI